MCCSFDGVPSMTVFFAVLALIVVAALALAVELLRPEPVTEQGLAELAEQRKQWQTVDAALRNIWFMALLPGGWTPIPTPTRG